MPLLIVDIEKIAALRGAGVVEQNIDAAELLDHCFKKTLDVGGLAHVRGHREHFTAELADFCRSVIQFFLTARANRHFGAFARELHCRGASDTVAAAGNNRNLAF